MKIQKINNENGEKTYKIIARDEMGTFLPRFTINDSDIDAILESIGYDTLKQFKEDEEEDNFEEGNHTNKIDLNQKLQDNFGFIENEDNELEYKPEKSLLLRLKLFMQKYGISSIIVILTILSLILINNLINNPQIKANYIEQNNQELYNQLRELEIKIVDLSIQKQRTIDKINKNNNIEISNNKIKEIINIIDKKNIKDKGETNK